MIDLGVTHCFAKYRHRFAPMAFFLGNHLCDDDKLAVTVRVSKLLLEWPQTRLQCPLRLEEAASVLEPLPAGCGRQGGAGGRVMGDAKS